MGLISFSTCISWYIHKQDFSGNTMLMDAVKHGNFSLAQKLLSYGANPNKENNHGMNPFWFAVLTDQNKMISLLSKFGAHANVNKDEIVYNKRIPLNILTVPTTKKIFYLTFDLGAANDNVPYILKTLKKYNINATFFVTGNFINKYPDDVIFLSKSRHVIGNHTYTHFKYYKGKKFFLSELLKTEKLYKKVTGKNLTKIWRAPGLKHLLLPFLLHYARQIGYQHIDTSLFTKDYVKEYDNDYVSNNKFLKLFTNNLNFNKYKRAAIEPKRIGFYQRHGAYLRGVILLMHGECFRKGPDDFIFTLEPIIKKLIRMGYKFGTFRNINRI